MKKVIVEDNAGTTAFASEVDPLEYLAAGGKSPAGRSVGYGGQRPIFDAKRLVAWIRPALDYLADAARLSKAATSGKPSAASSGVRPLESLIVRSAPSETSASTAFVLPIAAAMRSGV